MTDLFGQVGIGPGTAIILTALALGALAVLKIQELIRTRGADHAGDDPSSFERAAEAFERAVEKQITNAMTTHLLKLEGQRAEWALDAQRAREQHDREFRAELWAGVDAIRKALAEFRKGAA